jgi:hypothetical protein
MMLSAFCAAVLVGFLGQEVAAQSRSPIEVCGMWRGAETVRAPETNGEGVLEGSDAGDSLPSDVAAPAACPRAWHLQMSGGGAYYYQADGLSSEKDKYPQLPTAGIFLDMTFGFRLHPAHTRDRSDVRRVFWSYRPGLRVQAHYVRLADPPVDSDTDAVTSGNTDVVSSSYRTLDMLQSRHLFSMQLGRGFQGTVTLSAGAFAGLHFRARSRSEWNDEWLDESPADGEHADQLFWVGRNRLAAGLTAEVSFVLLSLGTVRMGLNVSSDFYLTDQDQFTGTVGPMLQYFPFRRTAPQLEGL